jgi:O-antigen ligase
MRSRLILAILILGAAGIVLAALPYKMFELDRYFVPKELVLHLTATVTLVLSLIGVRQLSLTRTDLLLLCYGGISALSAILATNGWLAERAIAITYSGLILFWVTRKLAQDGFTSPLLAGLIVAVLLGAATALAQAYGVTSQYMSLNRAPGGTLGNRNFMAHLVVIGSPIVLLWVARARRLGLAFGLLVVAALTAALVLSRSRAAWLAVLAGALLCGPLAWQLTRDARQRGTAPHPQRRWTLISVAVAIGIVTALALPNTLEWRSDSPYLDSVRGVVNYKGGSGHGRLVQYQRTLRLAAAHPLLGVGPGNWPVAYPAHVPDSDPSLDQDTGMASNPWPSSDWIASVSERGMIATVALALALFGLCVGAWKQWSDTTNPNERATALALVATIVVTVIVGAFDAVLLIAVPALLVWSVLGALSPSATIRKTIICSHRSRTIAITVAIGLGCVFSARSLGEMTAMALASSGRRSALERALWFDPGNYRVHMQLAERDARRGACKSASAHATAAHALYPAAATPQRILRRCR